MHVKDIMTRPVVTIGDDASLASAMDLLIGHRLSGLPVIDDAKRLCGVLSEGDLLRRLELGTDIPARPWWSILSFPSTTAREFSMANARKVSDAMSSPAISIDDDATLADAADLMEARRIRRLPVLRDGELVGMVSRADFVKALRVFVTHANEPEVVSDFAIREGVLATLSRQDWLYGSSVDVRVSNGRVTITGFASDGEQRRAARVAAETVHGVVSVDERIATKDTAGSPGI